MAPTQPRFQAAVLILCLKSCILVLLQYGKVLAGWDLESDFLQNDPRNQAYMGLETGHVMGEISTGIHT